MPFKRDYNHCIYLISFVLLGLSNACHERIDPSLNQAQPLYHPPQVTLLDTALGYSIHPVTGDSITPLFNYYTNDTIETGRPVKVNGLEICVQCFPQPERLKVSPPTEFEFKSNEKVVPNEIRTIPIDESALHVYTPAADTSTSFLVNFSGDTFWIGVPVAVSAQLKKWRTPKPTPALPPRMLDNAMFDIKSIEIAQGLSSSGVYQILEDKNGALWFGTDNEVSQYDGASFRHFNTNDGTRVHSVAAMLEDSKANIWLSTPAGTIRTDGISYSLFRRQDGVLYANEIRELFEDSRGNIWMGCQDGIIIRYEAPKENQPESFTHLLARQNSPMGVIMDIEEDRDGNLWFAASTDGVYKYDGKSFTHFSEKDGLPSKFVTSVCIDRDGNLWLGTAQGLCEYIKNQDGTAVFRLFSTNEGLSHNNIKTLLIDKQGDLWVATAGGVNKLTLHNRTTQNPTAISTYTVEHGLLSNHIEAMHADTSGNIWIGTTAGVSVLNPGSFQHYIGLEAFSNKPIRTIYKDSRKNLWFGTNGPGINLLLVSENGHARAVALESAQEKFSIKSIRAVYEDNLHNLWFGTTDGVVHLEHNNDPLSGNFTYYAQPVSYEGFVTSIVQDKRGNLWFGTYGGGLLIWKASGDGLGSEIIQFKEDSGFVCNYIMTMKADDDGSVWLVTDNNGLCRFQLAEDAQSAYMTVYSDKEGLLSNYLYSLDTDSNGDLWIGTVWAGLCHFSVPRNNRPGTFTSYTDRQGLSSNRIRSVYSFPEKEKSSLWVSTINGLNLIRPSDSSQLSQIVSFGQHEGLKITDFETNSVSADNNSHIWWSGGKGLERLRADDLTLSQTTPVPFLRQMDINGNFLSYNHLPDSLRKGLDFSETAAFENYPLEPSLSFNKNNLTFHFAAIDWNAPQKIRYSYTIGEYSDTWSNPSPDTKAEYRNLPSGTFTFKVRAIGESQVWSEPFAYTFTIRPPWYFSMWAYLFYIIIGGSLIYALHRFQLARKLEKVEKERLLELDTIKSRLYTNITHEFRTPLTLIHGPVSLAIANQSGLDQDDLKSIHRQSERLQQLITQMLDLQKIEAGKMKPNYIYGDVVQRFRYIVSLFDSWAKEKGIELELASTPQEILMDYDEEKLTQVISNLISNALRHTPGNGRITVQLKSLSGRSLEIIVADSGSGIGPEDLPFIFDRFYQSPRAAAGGTGIGLSLTKTLVELLGGSIKVDSILNAGTTFTVLLPITATALQASEKHAVATLAPHHYDDEFKFLPPLESTSDKPIALIIEDHAEVAQFVASCLKKDFSTMIASNGDEGIKKAFEHIPDLVVSDVMMPVKDGFEVCATLKKDIQTSHIPVILLTGRGDQAALMEGIEHGADAYVVKPFEPQELMLRAKKLLELRATLSEYYRKLGTHEEVKTAEKASAKENAFLQKIRSFIEEHMMDPQFNMQMLCQHMAMSHPQLHRKITALTGESTGKFVRSVRLTKAIDLLKNSDLTVSEIAYETGFSEPGYFTKVFSKEYQITPSEFRAGIGSI